MRGLVLVLPIVVAVACRARPAAVVVVDAAPTERPAPSDLKGAVVEAPPSGPAIALLYSTELLGEYEAHPNGGVARRATFTAAVRAETAGVVQVDAGDLLLRRQPKEEEGLLAPDGRELERRAELLLAALGRIGVDAFVPGETDLLLPIKRLVAMARKHRVSIVAANLFDAGGKPLFAPDRIVTAGGVSVGIFGVATPGAGEADRWRARGVHATDPVTESRARVASLRDRGAAVVVGLLHLAGGREEARRLLVKVPGIDVAVLGHDGGLSQEPELVGGTRLVAAGRMGRHLGRLDLYAGTGATRVGRNRVEKLGHSIGSDLEVLAMVRRYVAETRRRIGKKVPVGIAHLPAATVPTTWKRGKPPDEPLENWTYGSTGACLLCHKEANEQWRTTSHGFAMQTLQRKGRELDPECLLCHATAFHRPGGTRSVLRAQTYFADVGCESCHGPSVDHVRAQNKTGTVLTPPKEVCTSCHTPEQSQEPFDYEAAVKAILGPGHGAPTAPN